MKTSEEATCPNANCIFSYATPISTVTGLTNAFDAATNTHQLTLSGSNFPAGDLAGVELYIDGYLQTVVSVSATEAIFTLTGVKAASSSDIQVYFADGLPTGFETITTQTFTPAFVSVSNAAGSAGGNLIKVTGTGFGPETTGLNLYHGASTTAICTEVVVTGYGTFECHTGALAAEIATADTIELQLGGVNSACANSVTTACDFTAEIASSPTVTGASIAVNSISFVGTAFPTAGYTAKAIYNGAEAPAVISDANNAVATWTGGVPSSATAIEPLLIFIADSDAHELTAYSDGTVLIDNVLTVSSSSAGLSCSFAGGCEYSINAQGLFSNFADAANQVTVCGNVCEISATASSDATTVCILPEFISTYSIEQYNIVEVEVLTGTWVGTASDAELAKLTDKNNLNDLVDATVGCNFGIDFVDEQVGTVYEAKIFITDLNNSTPFVGNLVLQGSSDAGTTWDDLWTLDQDVHEGWNTKDFRDDASLPSYKQYRYNGAVAGSCRVGEANFVGVVGRNENLSTGTCIPKLTVDGVVTDLEAVTYDATKTPKLTAVSPRFGSVLGGDTLVLTGENFINAGTATVFIDGRECTGAVMTATTITCTTSDKPYTPDEPVLSIVIDTLGAVATQGLVFRYVSLYSEPTTWGGDIPPLDGESISIPKGQHLLIDVDSTAKLNAVIVEGSIIFPPHESDPTHHRTFDAHYVMVQGGYFEAGTEDFPYTSKLTITMHSSVSDPYLPIYGNKVIGVRFGQIEMHGIPRTPTWTSLDVTAAVGATSITLFEAVDW